MSNFTKVLAIVFSIISSRAMADDAAFMSVEKYLQLKKTAPEVVDTYLSGVLTAYTLSNAMLERNKQKKLYCSDSLITSSGLQNFIDSVVRKDLSIPGRAKTDVAALALSALTDIYRCK